MQPTSTQLNDSKDAKIPVPALPAEDYDVPKKFTVRLNTCFKISSFYFEILILINLKNNLR